jgi:hypothetical protein
VVHPRKREGRMTVEVTVGEIVIATLVLVVLNYLSVFVALATLRWKDAKEKKALANLFMQEVGQKLQTEANFQDIIKNLKIQDDEERDTRDGG